MAHVAPDPERQQADDFYELDVTEAGRVHAVGSEVLASRHSHIAHSILSSEASHPGDRFGKILPSLDDYPPGYPRLAALLAGFPEFTVSRRFSTLRVRSLLYHQMALQKLEQQLCEMDQEDNRSNPDSLRQANQLDDGTIPATRIKLMAKIDIELKAYDDLILRHHSMSKLRNAEPTILTSLANYFTNERPVSKQDELPFKHFGDLIALEDVLPSTALGRSLERGISYLSHHKIFRPPKAQRIQVNDVHIVDYSREVRRIASLLVRAFTTCVIVGLLIAPVALLIRSDISASTALGVIAGFTLGFSGALGAFTDASRQENFAATAAYCAVLVVFLGNLQAGAG